jgi:hypothetical protein
VPGEGWPSWAFENHDAPRHISRWAGEGNLTAYARLTMALLISLRGNIFLYQGQELALTQDEIPFHLLKDPEAIANWPLTLSRDGYARRCRGNRTPPWRFHHRRTMAPPVRGQYRPRRRHAGGRSGQPAQLDPRDAGAAPGCDALRMGAMEDVHTHGMLLHFTRGLAMNMSIAPSTLAIMRSPRLSARRIDALGQWRRRSAFAALQRSFHPQGDGLTRRSCLCMWMMIMPRWRRWPPMAARCAALSVSMAAGHGDGARNWPSCPMVRWSGHWRTAVSKRR